MTKIHPVAFVAESADIGKDVEIGPGCMVGPHVKIGDGTRLLGHVVVDGHTTLGQRCTLFPFASIGTQTQDLKYKGGTAYVEIGDDTTLREYVTVNAGTEDGEVTRVGAGCHIMAYCHVAHGCRVGNRVIMSNMTQLAGHIVVEDHAVFGGMTGVHQFVRIGAWCMVGGMSRVTQDCAPYSMIVGVPAEFKGINAIGLRRAGFDGAIRASIKKALRILFKEELSTADALAKIAAEVPDCPEVAHLVEFVRNSERGMCK